MIKEKMKELEEDENDSSDIQVKREEKKLEVQFPISATTTEILKEIEKAREKAKNEDKDFQYEKLTELLHRF